MRNVRRRRGHASTLVYDRCETRRLLAFTGSVSGDTLTLTQTADGGTITIDNNGPGNAFRTIDGDGTHVFSAATNVVVQLIPFLANPVLVDLDNAHTGDFRMNLGNGLRNVEFIGSSNTIQGMLRIDAGSNDQTVLLATTQDLTVGGDLVVSLGAAAIEDYVDTNGNGVHVTGSLRLFDVDRFVSNDSLSVQNQFRYSSPDDPNLVSLGSSLFVGGNFMYTGGNSRDQVLMAGAGVIDIQGDVSIDLGSGGLLTLQQVQLLGTGSIAGNLTVNATNAEGTDNLIVGANFSIDGNLAIDLGNGRNLVTLSGALKGTQLEYQGGTFIDGIVIGQGGSALVANLLLESGDDFVELSDVSTDLASLRVDFGGGADDFINNRGALDFNTTLLDLIGMNAFYSASLDQWDLQQDASLGAAIAVSKNLQGYIGMEQPPATAKVNLSPAANLRISLLNHSGNLTVTLDSPLDGYLIATVRNGDRLIEIQGPGDNAYIGGLLRIDAANGDQSIVLPNLVANRFVANLRQGADQVLFGATGTSIIGDVIVRDGGQVFVPSSQSLWVLNRFVMNSRFFDEDTTLSVSGQLNVLGKLTFLGGDGEDHVTLGNSGIGEVYIDMGSAVGLAQTVNLQGTYVGKFAGSNGNVVVKAADAFVNDFVLDTTSMIRGSTYIDYSANTTGGNVVVLQGTYHGGTVSFIGGNNVDRLIIDAFVAPQTRVNAQLADGMDELVLRLGDDLDFLFVDFGADTDTLTDDYGGIYPFDTEFLNLP